LSCDCAETIEIRGGSALFGPVAMLAHPMIVDYLVKTYGAE
jgi:hypothetical protein